MSRVELNPEIKITAISENKILVYSPKHKFTISGKLSNKYFIKPLKYYTGLIDLAELYQKIQASSSVEIYDYTEFMQVISMLLEREILLLREPYKASRKRWQYLAVDFLDYTNQHINAYLNLLLDAFIQRNELNGFLDVRCFNMLEERYFPNKQELDNKIKIIIPIFWSFNSEELNTLFADFNPNILLPVVCNNSYFSIGPKINEQISLIKAQRSLAKEMKYYTYVNYEPADEYLAIAASFLIQQIRYIFEELNGLRVRTRVNDEIMTFNHNAYTMDIKKYVFL